MNFSKPQMPGTPRLDTPTKSDLLRKYMDDDIFGSTEGGFDDEFKTIKFDDEIKTIKLENMDRFQEKDGDKHKTLKNREIDDDDDLDLKLNLNLNNKGHQFSDKLELSPTVSSNLNKKVLLSQYSESDTDVTEMNEDDFEDLELLGDEELHIKMNQVLRNRQHEIENEAQLEDEKLQERFLRTLKLNSQNLSLLDQIHNDSVKFETEDDFEEGWDIDNIEKEIQRKGKDWVKAKDRERYDDRFFDNEYADIPKSHSKVAPPNNPPIQAASYEGLSRPSFPMKKYKSTMDMRTVKHDNSIIRKLDRIPSFYTPRENHHNKGNISPSQSLPQIKKQQLERYAEKSTRTPRKSRLTKDPKTKIGVVKYLNHVPLDTKSMRFNAQQQRWEGNEHDLMRFERPALITDARDDNRNPNMVYDHEKLCWINLEEETMLDIPDLEDQKMDRLFREERGKRDINQQNTQGPRSRFDTKLKPPVSLKPLLPTLRGISHSTQRTVSSVFEDELGGGNEFVISARLADRFRREEDKIVRKTSHWFTKGAQYGDAEQGQVDGWEVRKLVME